MLEVQNLEAWYGASRILQGVNLQVNSGEIVALLGRNGVGKSTTLSAVMGRVTQKGTIRLEAQTLNGLPTYQRAQKGVALVPEDRRIIGGLTVEENLRIAAWAATRKGSWDLEHVWKIFPRLNERRSQVATSMSGGEQQMLAIARAVLANPALLMLDEPTQGLSPLIVDVLREIIQQINTLGISVLIVEQNLRFVKELATRAYVLNKGQTVYEGSCSEILSDSSLSQKFLGIG